MLDIISHKDLAESRLATQFKESTNLINYIRSLLIEADPLELLLHDILNSRSIDTAVGAQLDILGQIVGQPRIIVDAALLSYFGFDPNPEAQSFGDTNDPGIGGRFRSLEEPTGGNRALIDSEYRVFIKTRITKNHSASSIQDVIDIFKMVFNTDKIILVDGASHYEVQIGRILTINEKVFINTTDLLPKIIGVSVAYSEFEADSAFGFGGVPFSLGFGSVSNPSIGGKFASLI